MGQAIRAVGQERRPPWCGCSRPGDGDWCAECAARVFRRDGVLSPVNLFDAEPFRSERASEEFRRFYRLARGDAAAAELGAGWSQLRFKSHLLLPWLWRLLSGCERLRGLARAALGARTVLLWSTDWCVKPAGSLANFSWHQDSTYSGFADGAATVWVAFSDVGVSSGPVLFRRGSHRLGQLPHQETVDASNLLALGQTIPDDPEGWSALPLHRAELRAGQASAHHFRTVHSSSQNLASHDRVGLALRIVAADAPRDGPPRPVRERATLLFGDPQEGSRHFDLEPPPQLELGRRELAEWHESMEREKANYFHGTSGVQDYK